MSTLILLLASVLFGTVIHHAHQAEKASRIESQLSHQSAVRSLTEARDAADAWLVDLSGSLEFYPGLETIRAELLNNAITQYERLLVDQLAISKDQQSKELLNIDEHGHLLNAALETAKCQLRLGDLYRLTGRSADAREYYDRAASILSELDGEKNKGQQRAEFKDSIRLLQINVAIGRQLTAINSIDSATAVHPLVSDKEFHSHRQWLLEQLPMDHREPRFSANKSQDHQAQAASALVRYPLAIYRSSSASECDALVDESLQHAVQWARWLVAVRGEPRDIGLSETVQRELATRHESSDRHDLAVSSWDRLILDILDWHDDSAPRPDRLQSLAHARMRYAQCLATLGRTEEAANAYRDSIIKLNQAWQLLDADAFHQTNLAAAQHNLGSLLAVHSPEARVEAKPLIEHSLSNYQNLLRKNPSPDNIRRLSEAHTSLAGLLRDSDVAEAITHYDDVDLGYQMLADHQQLEVDDSIAWAEALQGRAECLLAANQCEAASRDIASLKQRLVDSEPRELSGRQHSRWSAIREALPKLEADANSQ